ncbi:hypothetical protein [Paratractidigestivibacter sp.]|uniref:hypothetical protein n=1 Tax=Paratractidigestivibacter sp. TaxID=2847316 RepID=UPI002ABDC4A4|nr:hypothetical protein [Paratractidigestivibacter sp.]
MSGMSTYRKVLFILSIIFLVFAVLYLGIGIMALMVGTSDSISEAELAQIAAASGTDARTALKIVAAVMIAYGAWEALVAILGIRGAKNPRKMGLVTIIYGIEAAVVIFGLAMALFTRSFTTSQFQGIVPVVAFFICMAIRREAHKA